MSSDKFDSWTVARQYEATKGYAFGTGDVGPLKELSDPGCRSCQGTIEQIEEVYGAGGHFEGGFDGTIDGVSGSEDLVVLHVRYGEVRIVPEGGGKPKSFEPMERLETYTLKREDGKWIVGEIDSNEPAR